MTNYRDIIYGTGPHPYSCGMYCEQCSREKKEYKEKRQKEFRNKCPKCGRRTRTHEEYSGEILEFCSSKKCKWAEK